MIYIASRCSAKSSHPAFKQRAIAGFTAAKPSDLSIQGVPHIKELAYAGYSANIDIFVSATSRGHKLNCTARGAKISFDKPTFNLAVPPVAYIPKIKMSHDEIDAMVVKFAAMDPLKVVKDKTTTIVLRKPSFDFAERLQATSIEHTIVADGNISPEGFLALTYLSHIATNFLSTQTYPAWKSEDDGATEAQVLGQQQFNLLVESRKRAVVESSGSKKKRRTTSDDEDESMSEDEEEEVDHEFAYELKWDSIRESVLVAKPSPLPFSFNAGGPADVPNFPGLAFPYFDRMMLPDALPLRDIILHRFLRCLGDSLPEQKRVFGNIKKGLSQIVRTKIGSEFMHLFIGIGLAIQTQTRLFAVNVAGDYAGFVLLGARFEVLVGDTWYRAKSVEDLRKDIDSMSSHTSAIAGLCAAMTTMRLKGPTSDGLAPRLVVPGDIQSGHDLWEALERRVVPKDDIEDLAELMRNVSFTRRYKEINVDNICWALDAVTKNRNEPLDRSIPLFVPSTFSSLDDHTLKVLCTFGPDSFSLQNSSGSRFEIAPLSRAKDPNDEQLEQGKGKAMPVVIVAVKGVQTACVDMKKTLKDKVITMNLRERASHNRCHVFKGAQRDMIYTKLREVVGDKEAMAEMRASGSRKRVEEEDHIHTSADLLALF